MMKLMISLVFLIPVLSLFSWWVLMYALMLMSFGFVLLFHFSVFLNNISYGLGVDMVSYWLILLTLWVVFLMIMASYKIKFESNYHSEFLFMVVIMALLLILCFSTDNLFMLYLYFESSLIPTLFIIFGWGYQPERFNAALYLLFYTLFASLPMLLGIFYIGNECFTLFYYLIEINSGFYLMMCMFLAFFIKMPMVFFHFWLPKAHVEAPISGSMILAGVLLKLGGYGMYRVLLFLGNDFYYYSSFFIIISLYGMVIVGFLCLFQVDLKSMIAYSSVSHMGLVICGILSMSYFGFGGSLVMMIGHGLCSSGLFCLANIVYERSHTRSLYLNKGLINVMSTMSMFWFLFCANNMSSPPSLNLLGEIMLINSMICWSDLSFLFLLLSSFLSCCFSIYLYCITQHGSLSSGIFTVFGGSIREFLLLLLHWIPLNLLFLASDSMALWM